MTNEQRCAAVLEFARTVFVNGQTTDQTIGAAERLGRAMGVASKISARWGLLELSCTEGNASFQVDADPVGVEMERVASAMHLVEEVESGQRAPESVRAALAVVARKPPAPAWLFAVAAGAGAAALAVIFGVSRFTPAVLIFVSAAAGALLRRALGQASANLFLQPFAAAILAGLVGALAVRAGLSSSLRLVAVCPCMILVPGPHILNGTIDLIAGRVHLGAARLLFALLVVVAIATGLLLGLELLGTSLPVDPPGRSAPLWLDVMAAGVAVASYSVFFSTPPRMLPWPIAVGMLAHALRWIALTVFGLGVATGALIACIVVGAILSWVSRRSHLPFAAVGFASVVSLIPGVYLFRFASGLVQIASNPNVPLPVIGATISDGVIATAIILAMSLGLIVPKLVVDRIGTRSARATMLQGQIHVSSH